jgi:hypothetical protein
LRALLGERPCLAFAHPLSFGLGRLERAMAQLQLPNDGWQEVLPELVGEAGLIVMDVDMLAPRVRFERRTIACGGAGTTFSCSSLPMAQPR